MRLTAAGKQLLEQIAEEMGISQAAVVEHLVREEARRRKIALPKKEKQEDGT